MEFTLFESRPGIAFALLPDAPTFTVVAVSNDFLKLSGRDKASVINHSIFSISISGSSEKMVDERANIQYYQNATTYKVRQQIDFVSFDIKDISGSVKPAKWRSIIEPVVSESGDVINLIQTFDDVTEVHAIAEAAEKNKGLEKAYNFFMSAPVIIGFLRSDDYIIEMANEGLLEVWGKTENVIGKPLLTAIPELQEQGFIALLDQVRATGEPFYAYEYPINLVRNGQEETLYFDFVYKPYYEEGSDVALGVISVGHEVTKQVKATQKVEESEGKYRSLFETVDQGFSVIEMIFDENEKPIDYRFIEINPVFEEQTGLKNAIGKTAKELIPNLEQHWFEMYGKVALTAKSIRFTESSEAMGRWFDVYAFPIGESSKHQVALLFTDITEQRKTEQKIKESEDRFLNLADESPIFVFIVEPDEIASVSYWNKTWLTYTGQTPEQAQGRAWDGILHPDDVPVAMEFYLPAFKTKQSYFIPAVRVKRHDGVYRWHAFKGNPRYSPNGDFNGFVGVGFDIHEQKVAEEALKQSESQLQLKIAERTIELERTIEELKRSNANLEEFAYAASHDLKEPVRKIRTFTDRLKNNFAGRLRDEDQHYILRMEKATERMQNLINDLLEYSHVSGGTNNVDELNLNTKVEQVLIDLEVEVAEKQASIEVGQLPTIKGNRRQMQQLFQNLITNALKFNKPGQNPEIKITARVIKGRDFENYNLPDDLKERSFNLIEIADNGIGFAQEHAETIFRMFQRLHGKAEYDGTGIGLAIVRKVVENHKGFITAESAPGEGATFKILLPIEPEA